MSRPNDGGRKVAQRGALMRRTLITAAALTLAVATIAAGTGSHAYGVAGRGDGDHSMDMDDGHGKSGKHGENARVVAGAREIAVDAKSFRFTPKKIRVSAGEDVTIVLHSVEVLHDFVVQRHGHIVSAKGTKTARGGLMIDEPGTYKFWCNVSGHRSDGMRGTIVVT